MPSIVELNQRDAVSVRTSPVSTARTRPPGPLTDYAAQDQEHTLDLTQPLTPEQARFVGELERLAAALATWLSGFALLVVLYYANASTYLVDKRVADISPLAAVAISIAILIVVLTAAD